MTHWHIRVLTLGGSHLMATVDARTPVSTVLQRAREAVADFPGAAPGVGVVWALLRARNRVGALLPVEIKFSAAVPATLSLAICEPEEKCPVAYSAGGTAHTEGSWSME